MSVKKFEILEMIAKGGMAEVYRAKTVGFQGFEKEVCVKKILPHLTEDPSFVTMFINEAKLAATLTYANIVSVHDLCVSAGSEYFIVMEYVSGKDLSDIIRAAQLAGREVPPDLAVFVCREVCKGLHYAHTKRAPDGADLNIIHRDISPHNVLVSFMGEVKITDFGIAKASSIMNKTAVGILKGKYGYMSPEQARGQPLDHRSDIFNLGIVLYELLVGERCFAGSSDFSTLNLMRNAVVTPPTSINSNIPKELETIVLRALSANRNDRYVDALEFESALARFSDHHRSQARASELASFMKSLFTVVTDDKKRPSTGVLSLSSVVGPAPAAAGQATPEVRIRSRGSVEPPAPANSPNPPNASPGPSVSAPPLVAIAPVPAVAAAAAVAAVAAKKTSGERPPAENGRPERKPVRLKPEKVAGDAEKKARGKPAQEVAKRPMGRKDLKPALTRIQALGKTARKNTTLRAAILILLAGGVGAVGGILRARTFTRQTAFREAEIAGRDPERTRKKQVMLLVTTSPPGATVRLDRVQLAEKTPLSVEREQDAKEHQIEFTLEGHQAASRSFKFGNGPLERIMEKMQGDGGKLVVTSKPTSLAVRIDGEVLGKTPLTVDVAPGTRSVEIGDDEYEIVRASVVVRAGETSAVDRNVASKGSLGALRIRSQPRMRILVDDKRTDQWTNDSVLMLEPEVTHRITLLNKSSDTRQNIVVRLKKGEQKEIFLDLTGST